jgi:hypothetical protein
MPDTELLDSLEALREAATPEPWNITLASWNSDHRENTPLLRSDGDYSYIGAIDSDHAPNPANAAYIVALVNAHASGDLVPAAELRALREVAEAYEALHRVPVVVQRVSGYEAAYTRAHTRVDAARAALARYHALKGDTDE